MLGMLGIRMCFALRNANERGWQRRRRHYMFSRTCEGCGKTISYQVFSEFPDDKWVCYVRDHLDGTPDLSRLYPFTYLYVGGDSELQPSFCSKEYFYKWKGTNNG